MCNMATFLLKTEPGSFSYADLVRDGKAVWDGVTSNAALAHLRSMRKGDEALIYHTGDEKTVVGLAVIASDPYEDPSNPGLTAKGEPKFAVVDLTPKRAAKAPLSLAAVKADSRFKDFPLVTQGRLSVMPVPPALDKVIRSLTGL
jgi:predicted RNA-binding protein with PUA-like domain